MNDPNTNEQPMVLPVTLAACHAEIRALFEEKEMAVEMAQTGHQSTAILSCSKKIATTTIVEQTLHGTLPMGGDLNPRQRRVIRRTTGLNNRDASAVINAFKRTRGNNRYNEKDANNFNPANRTRLRKKAPKKALLTSMQKHSYRNTKGDAGNTKRLFKEATKAMKRDVNNRKRQFELNEAKKHIAGLIVQSQSDNAKEAIASFTGKGDAVQHDPF